MFRYCAYSLHEWKKGAERERAREGEEKGEGKEETLKQSTQVLGDIAKLALAAGVKHINLVSQALAAGVGCKGD